MVNKDKNTNSKLTVTRLQLEGMHCASCAGRVQRALSALPGVQECVVNFATESATVEHDSRRSTLEQLRRAVEEVGYRAYTDETEQRRVREREALEKLKSKISVAVVLSLPVFLLEMGSHLFPPLHHWIQSNLGVLNLYLQFALTSLLLIGPGRELVASGLRALYRLEPDMNSLVALGSLAAYGYSLIATFLPSLIPSGDRSVYFESASLIVTLILVGKYFESRAKGKAGEAIERLLSLSPDVALILRGEEFAEVPLDQVRRGDTVLVKPGQKVPVDGEVIDGESYVEESMLTGEPLPVHKSTGSKALAGTLNQNGSLQLKVTGVGRRTVLAEIVRMVQDAQARILPIQSLVDRVTRVFVPVVLVIALFTFVVWWLWGPVPKLSHAVVAAVSVLIIACPCAMGLATPTSILVGTGRAAELGVLFRGGDSLQKLAEVKAVAFDKTGTLTEGKPALTDLITVEPRARERALALIASLESRSEHSIAHALSQAAHKEGVALLPVSDFRAIPGQGVTGTVDGQQLAVGNRRLMTELGVELPSIPQVEQFSSEGKSSFYAALDGTYFALVAVADQMKPSAREAIEKLHRHGLKVTMVSGDRSASANAVARELGIDKVYAEVLPAEKVKAVLDMRREFGSVAFVGDGINDAPALAEADVGVAIGTGTDVAVESADVILRSGEVTGLLAALALSRATLSNIKQNLFWAFAYNAILIPVAAGALYPAFGLTLSPILAAGAMAFSSVFVLLNALRLKGAQAS